MGADTMALRSGPIIWTAANAATVTAEITGRTLAGEHLSTTLFALEPHAVIPRHAHPNEELGVVLRGRLRLDVGDGWFTVGAGDSFFVAAGAAHEGMALDEGCTLLECYSPPRVPAPASEAAT